MKRIDFKMLLAFGAAATLCVGTIMGVTQQLINFADPLNEMAFAALSFVGAVGFGAGIKK